jgi:tRNA pseudouridine38-40 synthase
MHARFTAKARTYRYRIVRRKNPFLSQFAYHFSAPLGIETMNRGADFLVSINDFTSFSKVNTEVKSNICRLTTARWTEEDDQLIFRIRADRFLRNMVRAIVGTLMDLGQEKITFDQLRKITASKNRSDAGESVPARGLALVDVEYPEFTSPS